MDVVGVLLFFISSLCVISHPFSVVICVLLVNQPSVYSLVFGSHSMHFDSTK